MINLRVKPLISPYVDLRTISHPPSATLKDELSPLNNAPPSIRGMIRTSGLKERSVRKIFGLINLVEQRILIVQKSPTLFSQQS